MKHKRIVYMMVALLCMVFIALCILLATPAAAYDGEPIRTARQDDIHACAELLRALGYDDTSEVIRRLQREWLAENEALDIIARVVQGEAGGCPWMHQVAVAAVVVNRINSPLFPNTAREVVAQRGQYTTAYLSGFERTSRQCYEAAKKALDGESGVPEDVIFQSEYPNLGKEIWWVSEVDTGWYKSTTYFSR